MSGHLSRSDQYTIPDIHRKSAGTRFPLLISVPVFEMVRWPVLFLSAGCYLAWMHSSNIPFFIARTSLWGFAFVTLSFIALFSVVAPRLAYVQCRPGYLLLSAPLYRMAISYRRINDVGLADFSEFYLRSEQGWISRLILKKLFRRSHGGRLTVVYLELTSLPLPFTWLRLWFSRYVFTVDENGLLLMVRDWMLLKREIEIYRKACRSKFEKNDITDQLHQESAEINL